MPGTAAVRAEIEKLARLLGEEPQRFSYLEKVPAEDVRRLREQMTDRLFDADADLFARLAAGSRILPDAVSAGLAQKAFGPLVTARITGAVPVDTAVSIGRRLPIAFLAEVALGLDPRRASEVIASMPADTNVAVSRELARRREWVAMGRFVGHLPEDALRRIVEELPDEALLRIAFVIEEPEALPRAVATLSDERLDRLLATVHEGDLVGETTSLLGYLDDRQRERLAGALERQPAAVRKDLASALPDYLWR